MELTSHVSPLAGASAAHVPAPHPPHRPLVRARNLTRRWGRGSAAQLGVDGVDLSIGSGELVAVVGPSGSGKSTLGALVAGIDRPTSGSIVVDGTRIDRLRDDRLARWRGRNVGIVFQEFHLLPTLSALENVELAVQLAERSAGRRERRRRAAEALGLVGLGDKIGRLPAQLSGGEQQRVGVARAVVTRPRLIVADEPTGSLDQAAGHRVVELLTQLADGGTTVLLITHDRELVGRADRVVEMLDGKITQHLAAGVDVAAPTRPRVPTADRRAATGAMVEVG